MPLVVMKFGGTSVGSVERIRHVARLVADFVKSRPEDQVAVVVSAMAGETNRLLRLARSCVEQPAKRELDALLATGEQVSIALLAMALVELGVKARSFDAQQAQISTDRTHLEAHIEHIHTNSLQQSLAGGEVPVIAGFQGVDEYGNITTLGRGGSDITAVAVAAALGAAECRIYTDVAGVYSADPQVCPDARLLSHLAHEEMLEMASLGAKVLHPRSVYFAMQYGIPIRVLSSFEPGPGTWIVREEDLMEKPVVSGITYRKDEALVTVFGIQGGVAALSRVFLLLGQEKILVDMITHADHGAEGVNLSFSVPDEMSSRALSAMQGLVPELKASGAGLERDIAKVSVVGVGMRYHTGVAGTLFSALEREGVPVMLVSASETKISVVVPRKFCEMAVRALHAAFVAHGHTLKAASI